MNDQLIALGLGFVLGNISKRLANWWTTASPGIESALESADEKFSAKLGVELSDSVQATWHAVVHGAVAYVNKFASDGRFWREVIRAIVMRDASKAVLLQQELAGLSWDKGIAAVEAMMSPELRTVVNEVKETVAVKVALANVETTGAAPDPDALKSAERLRAAIRVVAPAHKPLEGEVTKEMIEKLIRQSQDRQVKLGGVQ